MLIKMKLGYFFLLFLFSQTVLGQTDWSVHLRKADADESYCNEFLEIMTQNKDESSTAMGYYALATMIQAKLYGNPFTKLSFFNKGKKILEESIVSAPENMELRFLRFAVQTEIPGILLYFDKIDEDKSMLDKYLAEQHPDVLSQRVRNYYKLKGFTPSNGT